MFTLKDSPTPPIATFIDLKSAYNRVNLTQLYEITQRKRILNDEKLQLLKFIHANIRVTLGQHECRTTTGVPQGLTTSPACFNVFMESLLDQLEAAHVPAYAYADDLTFVTTSTRQTETALRIVEAWCD